MKQQKQVQLGSDQYEKEPFVLHLHTGIIKNGDSKRSHRQSGLPIILLCFTQKSTCDSWKGFPGQLSARAPENTREMSWHAPTRGRTYRHKDVREGGNPLWTVLWTKPLSPLYLPSHPPSLWVGICESGPASVLDACLWPRGMTGNRGGSRIPTTLVQSRFWDNRTAGSRDGSELWTTDTKEYWCVCV